MSTLEFSIKVIHFLRINYISSILFKIITKLASLSHFLKTVVGKCVFKNYLKTAVGKYGVENMWKTNLVIVLKITLLL